MRPVPIASAHRCHSRGPNCVTCSSIAASSASVQRTQTLGVMGAQASAAHPRSVLQMTLLQRVATASAVRLLPIALAHWSHSPSPNCAKCSSTASSSASVHVAWTIGATGARESAARPHSVPWRSRSQRESTAHAVRLEPIARAHRPQCRGPNFVICLSSAASSASVQLVRRALFATGGCEAAAGCARRSSIHPRCCRGGLACHWRRNNSGGGAREAAFRGPSVARDRVCVAAEDRADAGPASPHAGRRP